MMSGLRAAIAATWESICRRPLRFQVRRRTLQPLLLLRALLRRRALAISLVAETRLHGFLRGLPAIRTQRTPHVVHLFELPAGCPLREHLVLAGVDQFPL